MQMAAKFKDILKEKSGGTLDVEFYTDGQLGGQTENCESLKNGTVDMTIIDTGTLANYNPKAGILDMPYLFASKDQAIAAADEVRWVPKWGIDRMKSMIQERADW